ncbi:major facilitator superfamily transporter [Fusarium albosuccineum]|uniref:Major facilitator superfamily transporter n=1 Tax=Fusarium albosuccineum TaxID=1237068 RepID=A0A8H4LEY5_9HYPO|nr:major facilitator superfamily transporter [Fusarium albosuccineum]
MGSDETRRSSKDATRDNTIVDVEERADSSDESTWSDSESWDATKLSPMRKLHIVVAGFTCTFMGNFGSSLTSGGDAIAEHFNVTDPVHLILLNSLYMVGYVLGPLLFGPLSEYIGRRPVLIGTYLGYLIFVLACSGAPNYAALLIFRLLCGINAAAPTTVIGGLYCDFLDDPSIRGNAIALYMTVTTMGPLIGPIVSGFSSPISWRWPFWIAGMMAAAGLPLVLAIPETYAPVLHNRAVRKQLQKKKKGQESDMGEALELKPFDVRKIFLRPMKLLFTEPILASTSIYLTLAYAIFYLFFQVYPRVFEGFYELSPGVAGLAFLPVGVGTLASLFVFGAFTRFHDRRSKAGAEWTKNHIYRRLPLACIASPCMVISLFWLGWTVWPSVSPVIPTLGGFFFGLGFQLLFMGMINYLTDVFRNYSASALAAASMMRSIGAILLPLAADSMYGNLGVHWAPSVLGFIALAMGVIPFVFIRYGDRLARSSKTAREAFAIQD